MDWPYWAWSGHGRTRSTVVVGVAMYDGWTPEALAAHVDVPRVDVHETLGSTMDAAHRLAEAGAPAGTVVLADCQTSGRGQHGRVWSSHAGAGVWLSVIERLADTLAAEVLSLRVGLAVAESLDRLAGVTVRVKRPNDLYVGQEKLGGILCEARWHGSTPAWVVVGLGVNVRRPVDVEGAAALPAGITRPEVLQAIIPAVRRASAAVGRLSPQESARLDARELRKFVL